MLGFVISYATVAGLADAAGLTNQMLGNHADRRVLAPSRNGRRTPAHRERQHGRTGAHHGVIYIRVFVNESAPATPRLAVAEYRNRPCPVVTLASKCRDRRRGPELH
jgi:hypothetical protein